MELKDQFQKLGDNSSTNDDCEEIKAELEALKKILGPDLKDKIKEKISSINDLLTKLPEAQKAVMAQAQQNIKGILNNKTFSNRFDALHTTSNNNVASSPSLPFPKHSAPATKVRNNGKIAETVLGKKSKKSGNSGKIRIVRSKRK